jgi:PTS system mannose-specific IIB component
MPLIHLRIDNRLIHGQVTVAWVSMLGANHIIVVNDKVAVDPIQKVVLPQAARGVKTSILTVDEATQYIKSDKASEEKIMIVAKFPSDALALIEKGVEPKEIIVGNQAPLPGTKFKHITRSIAVTEDQAQIYKRIHDEGFQLNSKLLPTDTPIDIIKALEKSGLLKQK